MAEFDSYVGKVKDVEGKDYKACRKFNDDFLKDFKEELKKGKDTDRPVLQQILFPCIKNGTRSLLEFASAIVQSKNVFKWKENEELMAKILDSVTEHAKETDQTGNKDYRDFMSKIIEIQKGNQLFKKNLDKFHTMLVVAFEKPKNPLMQACHSFTDDLPWAQKPDWATEVFDKSFHVMKENPRRKADDNLSYFVTNTCYSIYKSCMYNVKQALKYKLRLAIMFNWVVDQEWMDDNDEKTILYEWLNRTLGMFYISQRENVKIMEPVIHSCYKLWHCDDDYIREMAQDLFNMVPGELLVKLGGDVIEMVIDRVVTGQDIMLINNFDSMYKTCPEKMHPHLESIAALVEGGEYWIMSNVIQFFSHISLHNPQEMTAKCVEHLINTWKEEALCGMSVGCLVPVAEVHPEFFEPHEQVIIDYGYKDHAWASHIANILIHLVGKSAEKAAKYLAVMHDLIGVCESSAVVINLVVHMKTLGSKFPNELAKYEGSFEEMKSNVDLKYFAETCLDVIAGRSLEGVTKDVDDMQQDVAVIDERVTKTDENVVTIGKEVDATKAEVVVLSGEVNEQGQRLGELEDVVEETVEKVEEIDKKTLSHAPVWSRDVSKLLNPSTEHDWRLLTGRLGYTNDDIRNWATQADPCMSMFDEWFATNKTREATHAILKHLEEMDRMDAFLIVENALKQTEDVVEDEEVEYASPPPVFISYQWSLQDEVKLLRNHLEMAGFESWMDIGQMGGGDKLFEKIDTGIRAAKIIICCVSEKYAKSPNCNREVNLSVNLGKPIIPLLMEKMPWPPKGSMGPIFGEYLFIRFFSRSGEESGDMRYWPLPKFQELLMQIRYNVVPTEELIKDPYMNWMSPPDEMIVIKPKENKDAVTSVATKTSSDPEEEESPDVFISYQWGKQPQIKALYNKLSGLGYTCWLDILQMGGGDSLYDKIDKGVRGCKVVLTCVTSKYALSANCRREVSLADALKKPVIPLLLEKMTWPPEGPMSMVFTQLLYINVHSPDVSIQNTWECPQLEELKNKLLVYIPRVNNGQTTTQCPEESIEPQEQTRDKDSEQLTLKRESTQPEVKEKPMVSEVQQEGRQDDDEVADNNGTAPPQVKHSDKEEMEKEDVPPEVNTNDQNNRPEAASTPKNEPQQNEKKSSTCSII